MSSKQALVLGAGGFIGSHLVKRLKAEGFAVTGADLKYPEFSPSAADDFVIGDLRQSHVVERLLARHYDEIYQLAADMGGAGFVFSGENDADIMSNSAAININLLHHLSGHAATKVFYSSSACIYPAYNQTDPENPKTSEASAYPAEPDSEYGWEKLFSERLYLAHARNHGVVVRIARYHNIFGPEGTWRGGREKAPAALCRKIAAAGNGGDVEIWGDGQQTRSFLYIDECIDGTLRLMRSDETGPFNIGSAEMISINDLALMIAGLAGKEIRLRHVQGPLGVRGRVSDNALIEQRLDWAPSASLEDGMRQTYQWVARMVDEAADDRST